MAEGGHCEAAGGSGDGSLTLVRYNNPILVIKHPEKTADPKVLAEKKIFSTRL